MHKIISFAIYLIAIYAYIMPATAQNGTLVSIEQARKLIRQEKTEIESNYKEQEALCLKKFIATPCIDAAKQQKTKSLANVKQRELVLNDEERALKKAKIESKQTQSSSKQPIQASDTEVNNDKRSIDSQVQKQQQKQSQAQAQAKLRAQKTELKKVESAKKANRRAEKSKQEGANAAKYQSKVAAAQTRKQAKDDRDASRSKPKAAPLPLPSTATSTSTSTSPTLK